MLERDKIVTVEITKDDALILFNWLGKFNQGRCEAADEMERQALCNLEATLEEILVEPFLANYSEIISQAKERKRRSSQTDDLGVETQLAKANHRIQQDPGRGRSYIERSMIYGHLGRSVEQIADLTAAIPLLSSDPADADLLCETFYARGLTYQSIDDHQRAILDFTSVLELDKAYSSAFQARAYSYLQIGQLSSASDDVDRAAKLSPEDSHVHELRSRVREAAASVRREG